MLPVSVVGSICCSADIWIMRMCCGAIVIPPITMWCNTSAYVISNFIRKFSGGIFSSCYLTRARKAKITKLETCYQHNAQDSQIYQPMIGENSKCFALNSNYAAAPKQEKSMRHNYLPFGVFLWLFLFAHFGVQKLVKLIAPILSLTNFSHLNQDIYSIFVPKLAIGQPVYGENYAALRV
jgi:hypothetical protein